MCTCKRGGLVNTNSDYSVEVKDHNCKTCGTVWLLQHEGTPDRQPYCGWDKANN